MVAAPIVVAAADAPAIVVDAAANDVATDVVDVVAATT